jgi:hypothetical protein
MSASNEEKTAHARLCSQLSGIGSKPSDTAPQGEKKRYSERLSQAAALAIGTELVARGLSGALPAQGSHKKGPKSKAGAERRMAGGIGAKKVDVTWSTEESGLLLAFSVKSINFRDKSTQNYQKNLSNRRGDMLFEGVTLHRRFPYAVLIGLFFFDRGAATDGTDRRRNTLQNAHSRLKLFTGRDDPAGREEQFERIFLGLLSEGGVDFYVAGNPDETFSLDGILDSALSLVADRNPDFYEYENGKLRSVQM